MIKYYKLFLRKAAKKIKLLVMYWLFCYAVGSIICSNFAGLLLWIHEQILFEMFGNFGRIFFQAALVGCSFKERMSKELRNYNYKLFLMSATKIGGNTNNISKLLIFKMNLHFGTSD